MQIFNIPYINKSELMAEYKGLVGASVNAGLIKGYDNGTFDPRKTLSRAEAAVVLSRIAM
ncbi:S-layer homology domain-containing protein [Paenibacillus sp. YIM B09110]|uniref:S-layer homology domain-containing protein n=1 Tax=Paenibacillus sp. YIM B09110 TaxID=3126102 RepID=UPI00301C065C